MSVMQLGRLCVAGGLVRRLAVVAAVLGVGATAIGQTFVVTTTADAGVGSLRQAISEANAGAGGTITFDIPATDAGFDLPGSPGAWRIALNSPLPPVQRPTNINGLSQPGSACGTPKIEIRPATGGPGFTGDGLAILANDCQVRGLVINGFVDHGVSLTTVTGCTVACNFIGTDVTGTVLIGNGTGVLISNGVNNLVGGTTSASSGNLIAGNVGIGVSVVTSGTPSNVGNAILGNAVRDNGGLGIDLGANGVTPNDTLDLDVGPNHFQNFPVVTGYDGSTITATLESLPNRRFRIEFFANVAQDPTTFGEGARFIQAVETLSSAGGSATVSVPYTLAPGIRYVTATATSLPPLRGPGEGGELFTPRGIAPAAPTGTSEFSPAFLVGGGGGNTPPATQPLSVTTPEDTDVTVTLLASDVDMQALTVRIAALPGQGQLLQFGTLTPIATAGTVVADGQFRVVYRPPTNENGSPLTTFAYIANDGEADSNTSAVTVNVTAVNDPPVAVDDGYATDEDTALSVTMANAGVLGNDTDVDGDLLTAMVVSGPTRGSVVLSADGTFTYTPQPNTNGPDSFTYRARDGAADSNVATVTITVRGVNDPPVAADDAYATAEDTTLTVATPGAGVLANDSDAEGDALTAVLVDGPARGSVVLAADGTFVYTPTANLNGPDTFTYRARDGAADSNLAMVTINVTAVNDPPVAVDDAYTGDEDMPITVATTTAGVLANDSDVDGDTLMAQLVSGPAHGGITLNADGTFVYTPASNFAGEDAFTYRARDGAADSNVATVRLTLRGVNDPPVAMDDSYTTAEDTPLTVGTVALGVLGNDTDPDVPPQTLTAVLVTTTSRGTLSLNANGTFTYSPQPNFNGVDSFTYRARDGSADSNIATVTLNVTPVNDPPVARNDSYFTGEDVALNVSAPGVLVNDSDIDNDVLTAQVIIVTPPSSGALSNLAAGGFRYTPNADFNGTDSFTYRLNDGQAPSNVATVSILVQPTNDPPVAVADQYMVDEDTPLSVPARGVLENDTDSDSPPSALTAQLVTPPSPSAAAFELLPDGSFTFTPTAEFSGDVTFTYRASDGAANSTPATVTIRVNPVNDAPIAIDDDYSTPLNTPLTVGVPGVLGNDEDVDSPSLTAMIVSGPTSGAVTLASDGGFQYTPNTDFAGTDSFTYRASDGALPSGVATVRIRVGTGDNLPPIARCRDVVIDGRGTCPATFTITAADVNNGSDDPDDPVESLVLEVSNTGPFRIGVTTVTLTVTDPHGASSTCTATVTVLGDDCNGNGVPDTCDIANGSPDCNHDGVPDECQCLWDNGLATSTADGRYSQFGGRAQVAPKVADDFYIEPGLVCRVTSFTGQMFTNQLEALRQARLEFYEDCDGSPAGNPIATFTSSTVTAVEPGGAAGVSLVTYAFDLCSANLWLDGGKTYWVSLYAIATCSDASESFWATVDGKLNGSVPRQAIGHPSPARCTTVRYDPWADVETCCGDCENMAFKLGGAVCPIIWDNGPYWHCPGGGGLPSGRNGGFVSRSADNFVVKPCDDQTVCFVEATVWTNCNPTTGFVEIYGNECRQPGSRLFGATVSRAIATGERITINGVEVQAYLLQFFDVGWTLEAGRTYWLSAGATGAGGSINQRSYFAIADRCGTGCDIQISPAWSGNVGAGGGVMFCPKTEDLSFRIAARPGVRSGGHLPPPAAICSVDMDGDGAAGLQDLFDFLTAWFAGCP